MSQTTEKDVLRRIGHEVRSRRHALGLSLRALAERASLSPRFLSDVEGGSGNIAIGRLARLAWALEADLVDLVLPTRAAADPPSIGALLAGRNAEEVEGIRRLLEIVLGQRSRQVIALLGVRGAGKSTVGAALAKRLDLDFLELDEHIEAEAGMRLADIFAFHGEPYYRRLEGRCVAKLLADGKPCVAALPGGVVGNEEAFTLIRSSCFSVWLEAHPEDYWSRVFDQGDRRPIEGRNNAMNELRALVREREPLYRLANARIHTAGKAPEEVVDAALACLHRSRIVQLASSDQAAAPHPRG